MRCSHPSKVVVTDPFATGSRLMVPKCQIGVMSSVCAPPVPYPTFPWRGLTPIGRPSASAGTNKCTSPLQDLCACTPACYSQGPRPIPAFSHPLSLPRRTPCCPCITTAANVASPGAPGRRMRGNSWGEGGHTLPPSTKCLGLIFANHHFHLHRCKARQTWDIAWQREGGAVP